MCGYGERFWKEALPEGLLDDVQTYLLSRQFGIQPWEVGEIPEMWIHRKALFDRVLDDVAKHLKSQEPVEESSAP